MPVTVDQLLKMHEECLAARAELDDVNLLYPESGLGIGAVGDSLWESAYKRCVATSKRMRELMKQADPETVKEAREKARKP